MLKRRFENEEVLWVFSAFNDSHNHPRAMELALPHHRKLDERLTSFVSHRYQKLNPGSKTTVNLLAQGAKIRKQDVSN